MTGSTTDVTNVSYATQFFTDGIIATDATATANVLNDTEFSTNTTASTDICISWGTQNFSDFAAFVALGILLLLTALEKRTHRRRRRGCTGGRPALLVPVNFLSTGRDRWFYALAVGASTTMCLNLFEGQYNRHFDRWLAIPNGDAQIWIDQLIKLASAVEVGLMYFPFVACMRTRYRMVGAVLGLGYSAAWFTAYVMERMGCLNNPTFVSYRLVDSFPVIICHFLLLLKFVMATVECIAKLRREGYQSLIDAETEELAQDSHFLYVRNLLNNKNVTTAETLPWYRRYFRRYVYHDDGFRFSARMTTTMVVSLLCLYSLAVFYIQAIDALIAAQNPSQLALLVQLGGGPISFSIGGTVVEPFRDMPTLLYAARVSVIVSGVAALVIHIAYIFVIMATYRAHMRALYRGDASWMPAGFQPSTAASIFSGMKYSGSQIAYILWGYFVQQAVFLFICALVYYLVKFPGLIVSMLKYSGPIIGATLITLFGQMLLVALVFRQRKINPKDKDHPLAIDNKKLYHITSYFLFFFNVMLGFFSSGLRILIGAFFGGMVQARTDHSVLMRRLESFDNGLKSYLGMLRIEVTHTHPVVLVFCQQLANSIQNKNDKNCSESLHDLVKVSIEDSETRADSKVNFGESFNKGKRIKYNFKWFVLYTIFRNPSIMPTRGYLKEMDEGERDLVKKFLAERVLTAKALVMQEKKKTKKGIATKGVEYDFNDAKGISNGDIQLTCYKRLGGDLTK